MLLWANLHGGFIIGDILILIFIIGETLNYFFLKRRQGDRKALITLYIIGISAIAISAVNPNGFVALTTLSSGSKVFQAGVQEYLSPFSLYADNVRLVDWEYITLIVLFPVVALLRNKKIDIVYYIILCGFLYMSLTALRFVIYYVCIGAIILGREVHYTLEDFFKRAQVNTLRFEFFIAIVILISSLLYTSGFLNLNKITFAKAEKFSVPKGATVFIKENKIQGNMFNDMGFGGYFIWELYPWKKVFIDTRQLNYTVTKEYDWVIHATVSRKNKELPEGKKPLWERLLDHYDIDIIVIDTIDILGAIKPITFRLLKSDKWVAVYYDLISVVFIRDKEENRALMKKYEQSEDKIYNAIISRLGQLAMGSKKNPRFLLSLGDVFYNREEYEDALKAYQYADRRLPNQAYTQMKIDMAEMQIEHKNKEGRKDHEE
jgi:tetratricopeptide (TPR) repeat protein